MGVTDESNNTPENVAKTAYAELISRTGLLDDDPETWILMAYAQCLTEAIHDQTDGVLGEVPISTLASALGVDRRLAVLVARLCGMTPRTRKGAQFVANAESAPSVFITEKTVAGFFASMDW
jgi:hypothetical protein